MEVSENFSGLHSDTMNTVVELAQVPKSGGIEENGEILNSTNGNAVDVFQISPALFNRAVLPETSTTSDVNGSESTAVEIQGVTRGGIIGRLKKYVAGRHATKLSDSKLLASESNPAASYSLPPTATGLQKPLISLHIENGKVTCSRCVLSGEEQEEIPNISLSIPTVQTMPGQTEGRQINRATKLALKNFLKKKSARGVSDKRGDAGNRAAYSRVESSLPGGEVGNLFKEDGTSSDPESIREGNLSHTGISTGNKNAKSSALVSVSSIVEAENAPKKGRLSPNHGNDEEKNTSDVLTRTVESDKMSLKASISGSSSTSPLQSSHNFSLTASDTEGDKSNATLTQQSGVVQLCDESNQDIEDGCKDASMSAKELSSDTTDASAAVDVVEEASAPVTQEVDVVVLPSLLEPDITEQCSQESSLIESGTLEKKNNKSVECVECGKVFLSKKAYKCHLNIHYDIRPHKCTECGKSFRQQNHLKKHKLIHTGEKPYACQYCSHRFRCRYLCRDHERIHTGEKPCKCDICGEMFRCLNMVSDHKKIVHKLGTPRSHGHGVKAIFKCKICDKTFTWSSALSMHKKTHSDGFAYKCLKCPKAFKHYSSLWGHQRVHSNEKPFECDLCGQRLKKRGNLKRHILTQHDPEEAEQYLKTSKQFEKYHVGTAKTTI